MGKSLLIQMSSELCKALRMKLVEIEGYKTPKDLFWAVYDRKGGTWIWPNEVDLEAEIAELNNGQRK